MNNSRPPLDDVRVRKAMNHAIDKQGIIDAIFLGTYAELARAPYLMPMLDGFYDAGVYEYDPDKARELLEEAGWVDTDGDGIREKDGERFSITLHTRKGASPGDIETCELIQDMLKDVGVELKMILLDSAAFLSVVTKPPEESIHDLLYLSVGVYTGDVEYVMLTFYSCDAFAPRYYDRAYYCDPEVDKLIEESLTAPTMEKRNAIYADIIQRVFDAASIIQLFDLHQVAVMRNYVKGVYFEPAGTNWPGKYAWLEK